MKKLQEFVDEWFLLSGAINIGDWVPWLNRFDLQGYVKRLRALSAEYEEFLEFVIKDHREVMDKAGKNFVPKDMVDIFLQQADEDHDDPEAELTPNRIKALIHDMFAGGSDTSAATVQWAFQELIRNPSVIERATEELDRVIGRERWVEEKDFLQATVRGSNHGRNIQVAPARHAASARLLHGGLQCRGVRGGEGDHGSRERLVCRKEPEGLGESGGVRSGEVCGE